ncbi:WXG100 family type VII secretion target [Streptomyces sp. NPDC058579]|uniref:WXG100 family type VII secretion target n=1 Tax=Streptomyces sp. NPDC058579 TaxID=3346548 RepID=UPI003655CFBA
MAEYYRVGPPTDGTPVARLTTQEALAPLTPLTTHERLAPLDPQTAVEALTPLTPTRSWVTYAEPPNLTDGQINVVYSHMDNAAEDLIAQTHAIAQTLSNLEAELSELKKTWIGDDAQVYTEKQTAWHDAATAMEKMLGDHVHLLNHISGTYRFSQNCLVQGWQGVRIGPGH